MRSRNIRRYISCFLVFVLTMTNMPLDALANCAEDSFDLMNGIVWDGIYPIKIAGAEVMSGSEVNNVPDMADDTICMCPAPPPIFEQIGITFGMWEPTRVVDTVKDAYCFPMLGTQTSDGGWWGAGDTYDETRIRKNDTHVATNSHYLILPIWQIIGMLEDSICSEAMSFDVVMMTEVVALWNDDALSATLTPEATLYQSAPVQMAACFVNSVMALLGYSNAIMYWTLGGAGTTYPMTGKVASMKELEGNMVLAGRMVFMMGRMMLICDPGIYYCMCVSTPIVVWTNYRIHIAKPVADTSVHPIGETEFTWGANKNRETGGGDNFEWILFRRKTCCAY